MRDPGDQRQSSQKRAGGALGKGKGRGLPETGDAGRAPCATGVGGRWGVELARGAGRGGSWVPLWQESKVAVVPWFGPKQQEREEMGRTKKGTGRKWWHWGEGGPGYPSLEMLSSSRTGAGPKGEPWGSQGQALLKRAVGKS